jgi:hypothetical protein
LGVFYSNNTTILKKGGTMKYRQWDPKVKAKIVLEPLQNKILLPSSVIGIKYTKSIL